MSSWKRSELDGGTAPSDTFDRLWHAPKTCDRVLAVPERCMDVPQAHLVVRSYLYIQGRLRTSSACKDVHVNERLRRALNEADVDIDDVARATGVNQRTVQRWLAGRVPYPRYRRTIAKLVQTDETDLWPGVAPQTAGTAASELINVYAARAHVPAGLWRSLVADGEEQIDLLGSALFHLFEDPGLVELLLDTRSDVRIALADPDSPLVAARDQELRLGGALTGRIEASLRNLRPLNVRRLMDGQGLEVRLHSTPMYCSLLHVDDEMLVTPHVYGRSGRVDTPILHLRHREPFGLFASYLQHFEDVFYKAAQPLSARDEAESDHA
jgi:transcriptional regulator with XRE-family HTH domain